MTRHAALAVALLGLGLRAHALPCPPFGFDSVHNLDLQKFLTGGPWHAQLQVRDQTAFWWIAPSRRRPRPRCTRACIETPLYISVMPSRPHSGTPARVARPFPRRAGAHARRAPRESARPGTMPAFRPRPPGADCLPEGGDLLLLPVGGPGGGWLAWQTCTAPRRRRAMQPAGPRGPARPRAATEQAPPLSLPPDHSNPLSGWSTSPAMPRTCTWVAHGAAALSRARALPASAVGRRAGGRAGQLECVRQGALGAAPAHARRPRPIPPVPRPQRGVDVISFSNKGKVNGPVVELPKQTGGLVLFPQVRRPRRGARARPWRQAPAAAPCRRAGACWCGWRCGAGRMGLPYAPRRRVLGCARVHRHPASP